MRLNKATGRFELIPERVAVVRRIIQMAMNGQGSLAIASALNREKVAPLGHGKIWHQSVPWQLLHSRRLIGEHQVEQNVKGKRVAFGPPIPNYYPPVMTEEEWHRLQFVLKSRSENVRGRQGACRNLFGRMMKCGINGQSYVLHKPAGGRPLYLITIGGKAGNNPRYPLVYQAIESTFLKWVVEVQLSKDNGTDRVAELEGRLAENQQRIEALNNAMEGADNFPRLVERLKVEDVAEQSIRRELEAARAQQATPADTGDIRRLLEQSAALPGAQRVQFRERLRTAIQAVVQQINVFPYYEGKTRLYAVWVWFRDGFDRLYWVTIPRGGPPITQSDNLKWPVKHQAAVMKDYLDRMAKLILSGKREQ
jgi:hypothetical protein